MPTELTLKDVDTINTLTMIRVKQQYEQTPTTHDVTWVEIIVANSKKLMQFYVSCPSANFLYIYMYSTTSKYKKTTAECRTLQIYSRQSLSAVGEKVPYTITLRWFKITLATRASMRKHHRQTPTLCAYFAILQYHLIHCFNNSSTEG